MKLALGLIGLVLVSMLALWQPVQRTRAQGATGVNQPVPLRESVLPWPTPVHPQARLVSAHPTSRGWTLVFQESTSTVRIVHLDQAAPYESAVLTLSPPKR